MNERFIVTFDKSAEDIPVLVVAKERYSISLTPTINVINILTGDNAVNTYAMLTHKAYKENIDADKERQE